ncbi:MAG: 50S ribosomal protein L15 [Hyphomicrobiaceae bacterium]
MRLNELKDNPGALKRRVRVGRGIGSGVGKTAGRGVKGQKARSGVAIIAFEGGQMPLYRRLPKRGFTSRNRADWNELTIRALNRALEAGKLDGLAQVGIGELVAQGVVRRPLDGVRLVGNETVVRAINLTLDHATAGARAAVEAAGGTVTIIEPKANPEDERKRAKTAAKKAAAAK